MPIFRKFAKLIAIKITFCRLQDHLLCGVGGVYNCKKCRFLKECYNTKIFKEANSKQYRKNK